MKKLRLFHIADGQVERQPASLFRYERELQDLLEQHLHEYLDVHFLKRQFPTDSGYIDTLGIDDAGRPVIIEYKRAMNQAVVDQGLDYLDWLLDHRADFQLLVMKMLDSERAQRVRWEPRLLVIAGDFTPRQLRAVRRVQDIELLRYRRYGERGVALEWVHGGEEEPIIENSEESTYIAPSDEKVQDRIDVNDSLRQELRGFLRTLGDDVEVQVQKVAMNFKRRNQRSFASEVLSKKSKLVVVVRLDPMSVNLFPGFTRDVSNIGHHGNGDLEITIRDDSDLERAKPLLRRSYELGYGSSSSQPESSSRRVPITVRRTPRIIRHLESQDPLRTELREFLRSLGDDVTVQERKHVVNFVRRRSFASEVVSIKSKLVVVVRLEPGTVTLMPGFTRDVSNVGHQGNGNLEVTIIDQAALERAKPLFRDAYNRN